MEQPYKISVSQSLRRDDAEGAPGALEFVDLRQEVQQLLRDLDGVSVERTRNYTGLPTGKSPD